VFTQGIGPAVFGTSELTSDLSLGAGWAISLAVAQYVHGLLMKVRDLGVLLISVEVTDPSHMTGRIGSDAQ
jgi:hypothetical protein